MLWPLMERSMKKLIWLGFKELAKSQLYLSSSNTVKDESQF